MHHVICMFSLLIYFVPRACLLVFNHFYFVPVACLFRCSVTPEWIQQSSQGASINKKKSVKRTLPLDIGDAFLEPNWAQHRSKIIFLR